MDFQRLVRAKGPATLLVLLVLLTAYTATHGQVADSSVMLRLDDLLQEAAVNNPSLEADRLEVEALATRARQVSALPDPSVGITYQPRPILTARGYQRSQWRFEQTIPFPGKRALRGEIANLGADIVSARTDAFGQDLALQVKEAYYELYRVQEQKQVLADFQDQLRSFEQAALSRYEVGTGTQQAVLKAQLERSRLDVRRGQLAEDRLEARETLARLLNRPGSEGLTGELRVEEPRLPAGDQLTRLALSQRPEAEALRQADFQSERKIALARREFLPDISLSLTYIDLGAGGPSPAMTGRDAFMLSAGVKIPLWRDKLHAKVEEAHLQKRRVETRYRALESTLRTQIADLQGRLEEQREQLDLLEETLIPQAETTLEATLSAYKTDQADFLDLLDAERTLFSLQMDYEASYARYVKTFARLQRILGVSIVDRRSSSGK
jgi:outer membrane protein TolC